MTSQTSGAGEWKALTTAPQRVHLVRDELIDAAVEGDVFHAIAQAAADAVGAEGAVVTLVRGDEQHRVGHSGLGSIDRAADMTLCRLTVTRSDPLAFEDTAVTGPDTEPIRSYLGLPLFVDGEAIGTLAVISARPRRWSLEDRARLVALSQWPVAEIARIDAAARLRVAEAALTRATRVFDAMAEGVVGLDSDGVVALVNPAAARLLGWQARDLIGKDLHTVAHYQRADGTAYPLDQCPVLLTLADGTVRTRRHETFWTKAGEPLHVDMSVGGLHDEGRVTGAILIFDDIAERLSVDRMKDDFVSMVSHELRTPLTAVTGALGLLDAVADDPDRSQQMVSMARRNADRLAHLVDDILDLERAESGRLQVVRSELTAQSVMEQAAESVSGLAARGDVIVEIEPTEAVFWGDERRLVQVLTNLAGNAVRFSEAGQTVTLRARAAEREVAIDVVDHGPGIPAEAQGRIFDRFWQVEAGASRSKGGSGLGLAIAMSMAKAHGGTITVDSTVGAGSTFTLHVPLRSRRSAVPIDRRATAEEQG